MERLPHNTEPSIRKAVLSPHFDFGDALALPSTGSDPSVESTSHAASFVAHDSAIQKVHPEIQKIGKVRTWGPTTHAPDLATEQSQEVQPEPAEVQNGFESNFRDRDKSKQVIKYNDDINDNNMKQGQQQQQGEKQQQHGAKQQTTTTTT